MSGGEDNFLARWSRRKKAVEAVEEAGAEHQNLPERTEPQPEDPAAFDSESAGHEAPEPLPRISDITAESDLSPFLRNAVPQALKMAALRRAWSLDPAIRDFVGPAEYAYDYNSPGSIPGFGSAPAWDNGTAAEYVQKIVNPSATGDAAGAGVDDDCPPQDLAPVSRAPDRPAAQDNRREAQTEPAQPPGRAAIVQATAETDQPADSEAAGDALPRHGGAMPR